MLGKPSPPPLNSTTVDNELPRTRTEVPTIPKRGAPHSRIVTAPSSCSRSMVFWFAAGNVYEVPDELSVDFYPMCHFSSESKEFTTARSMARESSKGTFKNEGGGGGLSVKGVSASVEVSNTQSDAVKTAKEMQEEKEGSLFRSEAKCFRARAAFISKHRFTRNFLDEAQAIFTM